MPFLTARSFGFISASVSQYSPGERPEPRKLFPLAHKPSLLRHLPADDIFQALSLCVSCHCVGGAVLCGLAGKPANHGLLVGENAKEGGRQRLNGGESESALPSISFNVE